MKIHTLTAGLILAALSGQTLAAEPPAADVQAAKAAVAAMASQLQAELKKELSAGPPENAIPVCRDAAPRIASELSRQGGLKITRVSLKVRNPMLGTPDAWEQTKLQELEARLAKGEKLETLELAEVVQEPAGRYLRVMKGIPIQTPCLACHGDPAKISASVKEKLAAAYPQDKATGYSVGMLRGAFSVKKPLE